MDQNEILLCDDVRAKVDQVVDIVLGYNNKRVTIQLISDQPEPDKILKRYMVWVDPEYAIKHGNIELNDDVASKIALNIVQKQFEANGKVIPIEDGIYLSDDEQIIVDPKSFQHPLEIKPNE